MGAILIAILVLCWDGVGSESYISEWKQVKEAMVLGNAGAIGRLIGKKKVSLRLDGIPQGQYTAQQARRLLGDFFKETTSHSLIYESHETRGSRSWAEAIYKYRWVRTGRLAEERLLLELCLDTDTVQLCGIRSVSAGID